MNTGGQSLCLEGAEAATSTVFMGLSPIAAWKLRPAWPGESMSSGLVGSVWFLGRAALGCQPKLTSCHLSACSANKCVFCWRHHSNPVGKEWKWAMDPPDSIVQQAVSNHVKMVKEFGGVPGVKPEALKEAYKVRILCPLPRRASGSRFLN